MDQEAAETVNSLLSGIRPYLVLSALCAALFLPGLTTVPPIDRDEARFMQATKQMLETGDVVNIRFQSVPRTKKPVGIHWLQYLSVKYGALGDTHAVWAYRIPSVLAAWLSVICIFVFGRILFDAKTGLIAAALSTCTIILAVEAHLAKTDAAMLLTVIISHIALFQYYQSSPDHIPRLRTAMLFWLAIGAGLLIKGPIPFAIAMATALALSLADRNIRWLRGLQPEIGVPVAIAFVLPWMLASAAAGNGDVVFTSLAEDFIPKLIGGAEGHGALPGTHFLLSPVMLWPASLVLLPGIILGWQKRQDPAIRFALAWAGATWLMFELVPTKLPHYILPAVPALCLAVAGALTKGDFALPRWSLALWTATATLIGAGGLWAATTYGGPQYLATLIAFVLVTLIGLLWTRRLAHQALLIPVTAIVIFSLIFGGLLPRLTDLALSSRLAAVVAGQTTLGYPPMALARYHEPSAVFLLGTETWLTNARNAAAHIAADPIAMAVVADDQLQSVSEMVSATQGTMVIIDRLEGYNYAKGRPESLVVIRSEPQAQPPKPLAP